MFLILVKVCVFDKSRRCWHFSCDFVDSVGVVRVCKFHPNPDGKFLPHKVIPILHSVFDKHVLRRGS